MQPTNDLGLWNHISFQYSRELLMLDVYYYQNEVRLSIMIHFNNVVDCTYRSNVTLAVTPGRLLVFPADFRGKETARSVPLNAFLSKWYKG